MTDGQFLALTGLISALVAALVLVVKGGIKAQEEERKQAATREERHVSIIEKFGDAYEGIADSMKDMARSSEHHAASLKELVDHVRKQEG